RFSGLEVEVIAYPTSNPLLDIYLDIAEKSGELLLRCNYNPSLYTDETIRRWMAQFETLLEQIAAEPNQTISKFSLLTRQQQQVLEEWNQTPSDYPADLRIDRAFEIQVESNPEALCLKFAGEQLTYRELNRRANRVAHYLRALGAGPET